MITRPSSSAFGPAEGSCLDAVEINFSLLAITEIIHAFIRFIIENWKPMERRVEQECNLVNEVNPYKGRELQSSVYIRDDLMKINGGMLSPDFSFFDKGSAVQVVVNDAK